MVQDIDDHKREMRNSVTAVRQGLIQVREEVTAGMSTETRSVVASVTEYNSQIQAEKQNNMSRFEKMNLAISNIEAIVNNKVLSIEGTPVTCSCLQLFTL
jgi:hypothetical protein